MLYDRDWITEFPRKGYTMNMSITLTQKDIRLFCEELRQKEYSIGTIAQYRCYLNQLWSFLPAGKQLTRNELLKWKQEMMIFPLQYRDWPDFV